MAAQFEIPKFKRGEIVMGVYKMIIDDSHFYIGGSKNLRTRFVTWKTKIKMGINKNKKIRELAKTASLIKFEMVERVLLLDKIKEREDWYIKQDWNSPLLLNKCPNANNCLGLRFDANDLATRKRATVGAKKIAMYDLNWNFIEQFDFIADANKKIGCRSGDISSFLKGKCQFVKGYKFKLIDKEGNYIEPTLFVPYVRPPKKIKIKQPTTPSKPVIQYDLNGNEVKKFRSIWDVCHTLNFNRSNFRRLINKGRKGYYKGFIYKFAN